MPADPEKPDSPADSPADAYDPAKEFAAIGTNARELVAYAQQLVGAKIASLLYAARKIAILGVLALVGGIAGASVVVTAAALLVLGLADVIATFLPEHFKWAGKVIVGGGVLVLLFGALWLLLRRSVKAGKDVALQQYRLALKKQRLDLGHDAFGRAAAAAAGAAEQARRQPSRTKEQVAALKEKKARAERDQRQIDEDFARLTGKSGTGK